MASCKLQLLLQLSLLQQLKQLWPTYLLCSFLYEIYTDFKSIFQQYFQIQQSSQIPLLEDFKFELTLACN